MLNNKYNWCTVCINVSSYISYRTKMCCKHKAGKCKLTCCVASLLSSSLPSVRAIITLAASPPTKYKIYNLEATSKLLVTRQLTNHVIICGLRIIDTWKQKHTLSVLEETHSKYITVFDCERALIKRTEIATVNNWMYPLLSLLLI